MEIIVVGTSFMDIKGFPFEKYIPEGRNAGRIEYVHGGVGRNVVEDIANTGLSPTFLGVVDTGPLGEAVIQRLKDRHVNTEYILTHEDGLGTWLAVFDENGDVAGSISKRPYMLPLVDLLNELGDKIFNKANSVVIELDLDEEIIEKVITLSKQHHTNLYGLISNMSIALERKEYLKELDCFICNQQEAGLLFNEDFDNYAPKDLCERVSFLRQHYNYPTLIVTMGSKGAIYASKENAGVCPAKKVEVKDTTGAGDAFCAGVAIGLTYNKELDTAIEIGSCLSASVITSFESVCPEITLENYGIKKD